MEWNDHQNDEGLFVLYSSLKAPAKFLNHVIDLLDALLTESICQSFMLIPRGSVDRNVAIKTYADIDIDMIVPRAYRRPETAGSDLATFVKIMCEEISGFFKRFGIHRTARKLGNDWAAAGFSVVAINKSFSRSVQLEVKLHGIKVDVDLFPKLLGDDGKIWELNKGTIPYSR